MFEHKKLSWADIRDGCIDVSDGDQNKTRLCVIQQEFQQAFDFIKLFPKSVSIFGSARCTLGDPYYKNAETLAARISQELGHAVITGGGPGIMEAANKGAYNAGGKSIGMTIRLPNEQMANEYLTDELQFHYFFSRKVTLTFSAEAYIYFPGGFGTMDEFFEILTLVQTKKINPVPIILFGSKFWKPLINKFVDRKLNKKFQTISPSDMALFSIHDDHDEVIEIIKNAPVRIGSGSDTYSKQQPSADSNNTDSPKS